MDIKLTAKYFFLVVLFSSASQLSATPDNTCSLCGNSDLYVAGRSGLAGIYDGSSEQASFVKNYGEFGWSYKPFGGPIVLTGFGMNGVMAPKQVKDETIAGSMQLSGIGGLIALRTDDFELGLGATKEYYRPTDKIYRKKVHTSQSSYLKLSYNIVQYSHFLMQADAFVQSGVYHPDLAEDSETKYTMMTAGIGLSAHVTNMHTAIPAFIAVVALAASSGKSLGNLGSFGGGSGSKKDKKKQKR